MTNLNQSFQKAFAKGRAVGTAAPAEPHWDSSPMNYAPSDLVTEPVAASGADPYGVDPYGDRLDTPAANFRLNQPDWLAGSRPAAPPPAPLPAVVWVDEAPAIAAATSPASVIEAKPQAAEPAAPVAPPLPAVPTVVAKTASLPISISLSGDIAVPVRPAPAPAVAPVAAPPVVEPVAKEEPKQLRVEGKHPISAPHFGRAARHAAAGKPREVSVPKVAEAIEKWPALPTFQPIWEVDQLQWPAILDTLFAPDREAFRGLMDQLVQRVHGGRNLLAVAGCLPGDGATTLALGIARAAARRGLRVAVIDANTESPHLARALQLQTEVGWEQALLGEKTLSETAVASLSEGVHVFPLAADCAEHYVPWEDAVAEAFPLLATRHHLVVVDLGTIAAEENTPANTNRLVSSNAGLALLVRDGRQSGPARAVAARRQLAAAGLELIGVVENYTS